MLLVISVQCEQSRVRGHMVQAWPIIHKDLRDEEASGGLRHKSSFLLRPIFFFSLSWKEGCHGDEVGLSPVVWEAQQLALTFTQAQKRRTERCYLHKT